MNILCTLACSQIKRKKSRTAITIAAISLSTALLTAVINFAVSGNTMVQGFLGEDYGEFGSAYTLLLLIPAAILGALIIAMAVIVISNAFRMSANERVAQFGTLKCVGATKEQVYKTIMYECVILCIVAIPLGVVLGYLLSFVGIGISNQFMEEMNTLVRIMIKQVNFSLSFVFSPAALLVSVLISGITVFVAAMIPAKKAMKVSALDCLRNGGEIRGNLNVHAKAQINGKRSIEYQLARKNVASNRKQMKSAVMALSVSMILFVSMSGLKETADGVQEYMTFDYGYSVVADYTANRKYTTNPETGRREEHAQMISSELAEEILSELSEYQGTEVYGSGVDYATYDTPLSSEELTPEVQKALEKEITEENGELLLDVERIILDEKHYRELCQQAGVEYGGILLLNDYKYNDHGTEKHVQPLPSSTTSLKLEKADGSSQEIEIAAVLSLEEIPERLLYPNTNPVRIVVPKGEVRGYTWMTTPENENGYMEYARQVLESYFPQNGMDYGEAGYVSRVYGAEDYSKFMNIAIVLAAFVCIPAGTGRNFECDQCSQLPDQDKSKRAGSAEKCGDYFRVTGENAEYRKCSLFRKGAGYRTSGGNSSCSDHGILCKNGFPDFLSYALGSHSDRDCSFFWGDLGYGEGFFEYIKKTEHYRNNTNTLRGCSLTYFDERLAK